VGGAIFKFALTLDIAASVNKTHLFLAHKASAASAVYTFFSYNYLYPGPISDIKATRHPKRT
jgi:hypothetical protein